MLQHGASFDRILGCFCHTLDKALLLSVSCNSVFAAKHLLAGSRTVVDDGCEVLRFFEGTGSSREACFRFNNFDVFVKFFFFFFFCNTTYGSHAYVICTHVVPENKCLLIFGLHHLVIVSIQQCLSGFWKLVSDNGLTLKSDLFWGMMHTRPGVFFCFPLKSNVLEL